jgi:hypothetical protein
LHESPPAVQQLVSGMQSVALTPSRTPYEYNPKATGLEIPPDRKWGGQPHLVQENKMWLFKRVFNTAVTPDPARVLPKHLVQLAVLFVAVFEKDSGLKSHSFIMSLRQSNPSWWVRLNDSSLAKWADWEMLWKTFLEWITPREVFSERVAQLKALSSGPSEDKLLVYIAKFSELVAWLQQAQVDNPQPMTLEPLFFLQTFLEGLHNPTLAGTITSSGPIRDFSAAAGAALACVRKAPGLLTLFIPPIGAVKNVHALEQEQPSRLSCEFCNGHHSSRDCNDPHTVKHLQAWAHSHSSRKIRDTHSGECASSLSRLSRLSCGP